MEKMCVYFMLGNVWSQLKFLHKFPRKVEKVALPLHLFKCYNLRRWNGIIFFWKNNSANQRLETIEHGFLLRNIHKEYSSLPYGIWDSLKHLQFWLVKFHRRFRQTNSEKYWCVNSLGPHLPLLPVYKRSQTGSSSAPSPNVLMLEISLVLNFVASQ